MAHDAVTASGFAAGVDAVSASELHTRTRATLDRAHSAALLAVTHYNQVDAFLVSPERMRGLLSSEEREERRVRELVETLPLLLAAARAGVAIPSDTLDRLAPGARSGWQDVAEFAARYPVRLHVGEDGDPLARGQIRAEAVTLEEFGDDDDLNLDA